MQITDTLPSLPIDYDRLLKPPRCKNCRFWEEQRKNGICTKAQSEDLYNSGRGMMPSYDDSDVHTGPDFGCIHFEPKET